MNLNISMKIVLYEFISYEINFPAYFILIIEFSYAYTLKNRQIKTFNDE